MEYLIINLEGFVFHIYKHDNKDQQLLTEAKTKGTPLGGTYSFNKHAPHNPTGEYHLHVYDGQNQIFSINKSGYGHDGYHGTRIPNKVYYALKSKFPDWNFPKDQIIESVEETILFDPRQQYLRPVRVLQHQSDMLDTVAAFDGFFHRFMDDIILMGGKPFQKTTALIEDITGNMKKVAADRFRFLDTQNRNLFD